MSAKAGQAAVKMIADARKAGFAVAADVQRTDCLDLEVARALGLR